MSSFIGHSVAAVTVYVATEFMIFPAARVKSNWVTGDRSLWLCWLIVVASIPDLDYLVKALNFINNQGLRITHSIFFSSIAPCFTIAALPIMKVNSSWQRSIQVILAGWSHLVLDLLVGVTPLPLLFPLIKIPFKLPFGILPSAGKISIDNYYFYRNLALEMGVLLPTLFIVILLSLKQTLYKNRPLFKFCRLCSMAIAVCCISYFIRQNLQLPR